MNKFKKIAKDLYTCLGWLVVGAVVFFSVLWLISVVFP